MSSSSSDGYFQYLAELREELMALHASIDDACEDITIDTSKPNWQISKDLQTIIDTYLVKASNFGLYIIEKHQNYKFFSRIELTPEMLKIESSCHLYDMYDLNIKAKDERFIWVDRMYSFTSSDGNCNNCKYPLKHDVIKEYLFLKGSDQRVCKSLQGIWNCIGNAKSKSIDRSTRSGIREQLLLAILEINNELLPFDLKEYINHQLKHC